MSAIVEFSIFPIGKGVSLSTYVAEVVQLIQKSGLPHSFGPMGTCVEGEWDEVSALAGTCMKAMQKHSDRIYMNMKVDWRKGRENGLDAKVKSVRSKLKPE